MGGDHGHGHHHGPVIPKVPDWRIYKVDDVPELVQVRNALAVKGLKDPWLRNEVWRYQPQNFGTHKQRFHSLFLRGMKWGFVAFVATIALEKGMDLMKPPSEHGHGHH